uniref:5'-3' exonuclease PLD4 isoform X2 n=1 Tax=Nyctereutes procyonoides TaxID=34880 RepID=UPI002443BC65|nr:5'-3' exonuclease PLD4 isoform X2 [Nyctereutes procyonoides]
MDAKARPPEVLAMLASLWLGAMALAYVLWQVHLPPTCGQVCPEEGPSRSRGHGASRAWEPPRGEALKPPQDSCRLVLVESIPQDLPSAAGSPSAQPLAQAWLQLLDAAQESIHVASFYWSLTGADIGVNDSSSQQGEALLRKLEQLLDKNISLVVATSSRSLAKKSTDLQVLAARGAQVRYVPMEKLTGGVLHSKFWVVDGRHIYLGSANMDWRSLTQVKELGAIIYNCSHLALDLEKTFQTYWVLGAPKAVLPKAWPHNFWSHINRFQPLRGRFDGVPTAAYLSVRGAEGPSCPCSPGCTGPRGTLSCRSACRGLRAAAGEPAPRMGPWSPGERQAGVGRPSSRGGRGHGHPGDGAGRASCGPGRGVSKCAARWGRGGFSWGPGSRGGPAHRVALSLRGEGRAKRLRRAPAADGPPAAPLAGLGPAPRGALLHRAPLSPLVREVRPTRSGGGERGGDQFKPPPPCPPLQVVSLAFPRLPNTGGWVPRRAAVRGRSGPSVTAAREQASPPVLCPHGRTRDLEALLAVMGGAQDFIYASVMEYFPTTRFVHPARYWPVLDTALRAAAFNRGVRVRLLVSCWPHTDPSMFPSLRSLQAFSNPAAGVSVDVKVFIVPVRNHTNIPFSRVNHSKFVVTEKAAYVGTSNWSEDYFSSTSGVSLVVSQRPPGARPGVRTVQEQLRRLFERDWDSQYAVGLDGQAQGQDCAWQG